MNAQVASLFDLLPALYKIRDAQVNSLSAAQSAKLLALQNAPAPLSPADQLQLAQLVALSRGPLQSLLMLMDEQLAILANDLDQFYDDQFIETCVPWVIPYIGDLIGYQPVHGVSAVVSSPRAKVAHSISFRRRKGTVLVLEQLARDVTDWGAHAVEFFRLLATTQSMKHLRPGNLYAPALRDWQACQYIGTGFDTTAHTAEARRVASQRGRYNLQNVGIFLWPLNSYTLTNVTVSPIDSPIAASGRFYRFNPLGVDTPLFNNPISQGSQITVAAQPVNVPGRLLRRVLCQNNQGGTGAAYYGQGNSIAVSLNGTLLSSYRVQVCNLSGPDGQWSNVPASDDYAAAIDPELGRIALPPQTGAASSVEVSFCYGFNGDVGGGEYPRSSSFTVKSADAPVLQFPSTTMPYTNNLQQALVYAVGNVPAMARSRSKLPAARPLPQSNIL